jgi:hypothetical protein
MKKKLTLEQAMIEGLRVHAIEKLKEKEKNKKK